MGSLPEGLPACLPACILPHDAESAAMSLSDLGWLPSAGLPGCPRRCPDPKCGAPLAPGVLQRVLSPDDYSRWEQLTLQRTLDTMPGRVDTCW